MCAHKSCFLVFCVFEGGQRCGYTPLTTGRRCHHPLGCYSDHVFACAQGPGMRRHNRIRDVWIQLCRRAGWHTDTEQLMYIAQGETKRADLVTLSQMASGPRVILWSLPSRVRGSHTAPTLTSVRRRRPPDTIALQVALGMTVRIFCP